MMNDWELTGVSRPVGSAGHNRGRAQCHTGMRQAPLTVDSPHFHPHVQASVNLGESDPELRCEANVEMI